MHRITTWILYLQRIVPSAYMKMETSCYLWGLHSNVPQFFDEIGIHMHHTLYSPCLEVALVAFTQGWNHQRPACINAIKSYSHCLFNAWATSKSLQSPWLACVVGTIGNCNQPSRLHGRIYPRGTPRLLRMRTGASPTNRLVRIFSIVNILWTGAHSRSQVY
jgi:hypothetical protein